MNKRQRETVATTDPVTYLYGFASRFVTWSLAQETSPSLRYGLAPLALLIAILVKLALNAAFAFSPVAATPFLTIFAAIMVAALFGGFGPGLLVTLLGAVATDYFFLTPHFDFMINSVEDWVNLIVFVLEGILVSGLWEILRRVTYSRTREIEERLHIQENLAHERERYAVTLTSIGDAVIAVDNQNRITFLNPVAATLTGWQLAEAQGQPLDAVFHIINEETRQPVENPSARVLREGVVVGLANHTVLLHKDGLSQTPIDDSGAPIRDAQGQVTGVVLVFRDITERKQLEAERNILLERERAAHKEAEAERNRLTSILMQAPAIIAVQEGPRHVFRLLNPLAHQLLGGRDVTGLDIYQALPEVEGQGFIAVLDQVYRTGEAFNGPETFVQFNQPDGNVKEGYYNLTYQPWYDTNGQISGVLTFSVEITNQVLARRKMEESEQNFRTLTEAIPQIVWTSPADKSVDYFNQRWFDYTGLTPEESYGPIQWLSQVHPEDQAAIYQTWTNSTENEAQPAALQYRLRRKDGVYRWHLARSIPLQNEQGRIVRWFGTATDIEDQKQAEVALTELNRLKDQFLSVAGHELRTPLTSVKGYTQVLSRSLNRYVNESKAINEGPQSVETQSGSAQPWFNFQQDLQRLSRIEQQTNRMGKLISDMLDISRLQTGQLSLDLTATLDFVQLGRRVVEEQVQNQAVTKDTHQLYFGSKQAAIVGNGDEMRLEQVLSNLVTNALKYSPPDSRVDVTVEQNQPNEVLFRVRDQGYGISPADQVHIFERFYRVQKGNSERQSGLGLGLYISYEIVTHHGGRMWVESRAEGQGSIFYVAIPLHPAV